MGILTWLVIGLIAGGIARLVVPGQTNLGCLGTMVLGLAGSLLGGFLGNLIFGDELRVSASGLIGSVAGAIIVLLLLKLFTGRDDRMRPA